MVHVLSSGWSLCTSSVIFISSNDLLLRLLDHLRALMEYDSSYQMQINLGAPYLQNEMVSTMTISARYISASYLHYGKVRYRHDN